MFLRPKCRPKTTELLTGHFTKVKNLNVSENIITKVKRLPPEWENIFISHISDKKLVSRLFKELLQFNNEQRI